jgi:dTDP-4-amino-4,6-dideoxygalactose transaminase
MTHEEIPVTRPLVPPLEEFIPYLERIWSSGWLTNGGPYHQEFERVLARHLGVEYLSLFTNGTIALVTALQTLRITGQVITTPYSFVATAHSLLWNAIEPVFVDVQPDTLNLDPEKIVEAITPRTTAIMPVHCYGTPCDVDRIQEIADLYGLKVIYDAAHAFGVQYRDEPLVKHGDLSMLSFHATKVFNTFEGGALICPDPKTKQRVDFLKNFGHSGEVSVVAPGINGKMNEIQAAFGLLQLKHVDAAIEKRRAIDARYRRCLEGVAGISPLDALAETVANFGYFPIMVGPEYPLSRDALYARLRESGILVRRYFYPLITEFPMYRGLPSAARENLPNAWEASRRVLCLPIYPDLDLGTVERITDLVASAA